MKVCYLPTKVISICLYTHARAHALKHTHTSSCPGWNKFADSLGSSCPGPRCLHTEATRNENCIHVTSHTELFSHTELANQIRRTKTIWPWRNNCKENYVVLHICIVLLLYKNSIWKCNTKLIPFDILTNHKWAEKLRKQLEALTKFRQSIVIAYTPTHLV